jgi:hypothetical protein
MWLNRLPPDYRRRFYTNVAVLCGFVAFIFIVPRLGPTRGTFAIELLLIGIVLFGHVFPLVRLLRAKPRAPRAAFITYVAWIGGYAVFAIGLALQSRAIAAGGLFLAVAGMLTCFVAYRKIILPSIFGGEFRERFSAIREAREADRKERDEFIESLRRPNDR